MRHRNKLHWKCGKNSIKVKDLVTNFGYFYTNYFKVMELSLMVSKKISLSDPVLGKEEKKALCDTIDSGWLTMGERVAKFELAFAALHGAIDAVAVSSCTAGLHLCLKALEIGPGDEVLVPSISFVATVNSVLYVGATPVFVDIDSENMPHISLKNAALKCTPKTKAVIVMHYGGYLINLKPWRKLADEKQIFLIEDAAHAPALDGVGQASDSAVFSFFSNKNMSTAEGGMILARDNSVLNRVRNMRSHGMTTDTLTRHRGHAYSYDVIELGFNYRMDELRASVGLVQLGRLKQWNRIRKELSHYYRHTLLNQIPQVTVPFEIQHKTAAHLMPILLPYGVNRKIVMRFLKQKGIQTSIHYPPIHKFSYYQQHQLGNINLPNTESFAARELTLPLHPRLSKEQIDTVVKELKEAISNSN